MAHKSGFVNLVGKPNAGKSTLMNQLVGEKLSIITSKAQTTRHRIMGIVSGDDFQFVYSDTPGILEPKYELHKSMMDFVYTALDDADLLIVVIDATDSEGDEFLAEKLKKSPAKKMVLLNKIDQTTPELANERLEKLKAIFPNEYVSAIAALHGFNTAGLQDKIMELLPEGPAYFPKDEMTDKTERFFAQEIIREKIFTTYSKEIPYSTEVKVTSFKDEPNILKIEANIYCERASQKKILIGLQGSMLKKVGTNARADMEAFFGKKIFLSLYVRVEEGWRTNRNKLKRFGYVQG